MSILSGLFERRGELTVGERRALSLLNIEQWRELGLSPPSLSGVSVSESSALTYSAVFSCVRVLSETLASLPLIMYERLERGKRKATDHHLFTLLRDAPNPLQTAYELKVDLMVHLCLWGNSYCQLDYDRAGRVTAIWPLRPDKMVEVRRDAGRLFYVYELPNGRKQTISGDLIWHQRTLGVNNLTGQSVIKLHRLGVGLGLAAERYGSAFFGNNATPSGVLEHPGVLGKEASDTLRESWEDVHKGIDRSHRMAILEEGMKYKQVGIPPEDAQYLETRLFQKREIAGIFRVPPHMIADLERATFSNIEHQGIEFLSYSMLPWLINWEQGVKLRLMLARDRDRYFAEFLTAALERGDIKSRYEAYAVGRQNGWMSANDIRELENLNPIEDGDIYLVPLNMIPAGTVPDPEAVPGAADERSLLTAGDRSQQERRAAADERSRLEAEYKPLFLDVMGRTIRREVSDIRREARKLLKRGALADFLLWLDGFYEDHGEFISSALTPAYLAYAAAVIRAVKAETGKSGEVDPENFIAEYAKLYGVRYTEARRKSLTALIDRTDEDELLAEIEVRLDEIAEEGPEQETRRELQRANNALALLSYAVLGVTIKRWAASGDSCPYCLKLDGMKVEIHGYFIPSGGSVDVPGQEPMRVDINLGHPPVHDGCDCKVVAG